MSANQTAVIVGAGPAGLFCAYSLARGSYPGRVLLIEQGKPFSERFLGDDEWNFDPHDVLKGEGGAGFLADAKLCLSGTAGVQFDPQLAADYPRALDDLDFHIYQQLLDLGHEIRRAWPNSAQLRAARSQLDDLGLELDSYPVRPLGSDMASTFLGLFVNELRQLGVELQYETSARRVTHDPASAHFRMILHGQEGDREIIASHVFLAVGWSGGSWLLKQPLPLIAEPNNLDLGVRLEFPAWGGEQLREVGENPKIKFRDGHSYSKTHCLVHRGRVFFFYLGDDACLVDAHAVRAQPTSASAVNILYRVSTKVLPRPLELLHAVTRATEAVERQSPLAMPMPEFLGRSDLPGATKSFTPTLSGRAVVMSDLGLVLPARIVSTIRQHITLLSEYAPGIATKDGMVYAPAAQWVQPRIRLGPRFSVPNVPNLYCIGDGSGLTAGVLPAAVSGVVAAKHALAGLRGNDQLTMWSFP